MSDYLGDILTIGIPPSALSRALINANASVLAAARGKAIAGRNLPVILAGDSRNNNAFVVATGSAASRRVQFGQNAFWIQAAGMDVDVSKSTALGGTTTQHLVDTQLPAILLVKDQISAVFLISGTNDDNAGISIATTKANYKTFFTTLAKYGIPVVTVAELPRGDATKDPTYTFGTNAARKHAAMRAWLLRTAPKISPLVRVIDPWPLLRDNTQTTNATAYGQCNAAYFNDGLHQNNLGSYTIMVTAAVVDALKDFCKPRYPLFCDASDIYDATYNAEGNRIANGLITGTAGNSGSTGISNIPTSYNASSSNLGGITVTVSQVTTSTGKWCQLAFSGTSTAAATTTITTTAGSTSATVASATGISVGQEVVSTNIDKGTVVSAINGTTVTLSNTANATASGTAVNFYGVDPTLTLQTTISSTFSAGDVGFAGVEFEIDATCNGLRAIDAQLQRTLTGGTDIVQGGARNASYDANFTSAFSGIIKSPEITFDGTETAQSAYIRFILQPGVVSFTARLRNHTVASISAL